MRIVVDIDIEIAAIADVHAVFLQRVDATDQLVAVVQRIECEMPMVYRFQLVDTFSDVIVHQTDVQSLIKIDLHLVLNNPIRDLEEPVLVQQNVVIEQHYLLVLRIVELGRMLIDMELALLFGYYAKVQLRLHPLDVNPRS